MSTYHKKQVEFMAKAFEAISDLGITIYSADGKIVYYNQSSAINDEIDREYAIGKTPLELYEHQTKSTALEVLKSGKAVIDERITYKSRSGRLNHCVGSTYPIFSGDELIGAISVIRFNDNNRRLVNKILELQKQLASKTNTLSNGTVYTLDDLIGDSEELKNAIYMARKCAQTYANVLIYGETGTGKEIFAQGIHNASWRSQAPFIAINCSAIPETLLESIFFGTEAGAFTGAKSSPGVFEQAKGGTVFLDELNSMPLPLQAKLLRVLQQKVVTPLGSNKQISIDCTVIASTNLPPQECLDTKILREDLYYRISGINLTIPPLRERKGDIITLANHFIKKSASTYGVSNIVIGDSFRRALLQWSWPGNVRELEHVIETVMIMTHSGAKLTAEDLPESLRNAIDSSRSTDVFSRPNSMITAQNLKDQLAQYERQEILSALNANNWNVTKTANSIGYTRSNLQFRMQKLGISEDNNV